MGQPFFDPQWTSDGELYAPLRLKAITYERYLISKHSNTSYIDTLNITPTERQYLISFIIRDLNNQKEALGGANNR